MTKHEPLSEILLQGGASSGGGKSAWDREEEQVDWILQNEGTVTIHNDDWDTDTILEHYSWKELKDIFLEARDYANRFGGLSEDDSWQLIKKDGSYQSYVGGDDMSDAKLTGVVGLVWSNASTQGFAGKGVTLVNHDREWSDWRFEAKSDFPEEAAKRDERLKHRK